LFTREKSLNKQTKSATEIQTDINTQLKAAGLDDKYRVGVPARLTPPAADGHNWHFLDVLTGNIEEMETVTRILSDASRKYLLA
jgi:hypothetical protein